MAFINTIAAFKVLTIAAFSFLTAQILVPIVTEFLYKNKFWRKSVRTKAIDGQDVSNFQKLHGEGEVKTPRMGGVLIWLPPLVVAFILHICAKFGVPGLAGLDFFTRDQTWIPFFALVVAAIVGLVDDLLQVKGKGDYIAGGLSLRYRLLLFAFMGFVGGWWCYYKLGWSTVYIPFVGDVNFGIFYILFFIIVMMATYSGGVIDGIDGLAAGSFLSMFGAYGLIAWMFHQYDLASFCFAIFGSLLTYLWFNIPPAKFYMGETGSMALCASLAVVAFFTNSVMYLPLIGFLLVWESLSVIIQLLSKRFLKKKFFLAAPIHLHYEAKGWPPYKVTMRFWVIGVICAILGIIARLAVLR